MGVERRRIRGKGKETIEGDVRSMTEVESGGAMRAERRKEEKRRG